VGGGGQGIERPFSHISPLRAGRSERPVGRGDQSTRRGTGHQGDHGAALRFGQARLASAARLHAQPIKSTRVEGVDALAHRLGMTIQFLGNDAGAQPIPAACDHPGMYDPIGGGMVTTGEAPHLAFFGGIQGRASSE
jgi:hypothetical protein